MFPPKKYSEEELKTRCKRCLAPSTIQSPSSAESGQVSDIPAKDELAKDLERAHQMETLFAQFKASVDMDEKEALAAFLKVMEGPRSVEPAEFRRMG